MRGDETVVLFYTNIKECFIAKLPPLFDNQTLLDISDIQIFSCGSEAGDYIQDCVVGDVCEMLRRKFD